MRLRLLAPTCALATCLLYAGMSNAQTTTPDSAYFDLGRVKLKKNFTQNVTIKGADLERFPFSNLSEAINVWLNGNYTNTSMVKYVVDGLMVTDVNQYSVYDIDEVTMVQNAIGTVNGTAQMQQLILIKTKRNFSKKSGVEVAGQANLVDVKKRGTYSNDPGFQKDTKLYQQYNISAYKNFDKLHVGLSANYLRDVNPVKSVQNSQILTAPNLDRWRFNGYLNAEVWKGSTLDINIGYAPQTLDRSIYYILPNLRTTTNADIQEKLLNSSLKLSSQILPGLTNEIKAGYARSKNELNNSSSQNLNASVITLNTVNEDNKLDNFVISDELRYAHAVGNFTISPAVNFSYRYFKNSVNYDNRTTSNGTIQQIFKGMYQTKLKTSLLTPTIDVSYKDLINITGGLSYIIKSEPNPNIADYKKTFPFITATIDAARLVNSNSPVSAKVYGSYALSNNFNDISNTLSDVISPLAYTSYTAPGYSTYTSLSRPDKYFKTLSAGAEVGLLKNVLILSYNYENRKNVVPVYISQPLSNFAIYADAEIKSHRIAVSYNFTNQHNFSWRSTINTTNSIQTVRQMPNYMIGEISAGRSNWTGGFANRLQYKNWIGGADVLYLFGKNPNPTAQNQNLRSFSLQNAYIGLNIKTSLFKTFEAYANARNILQNNKSTFNDYRRYFGLGFKAGF